MGLEHFLWLSYHFNILQSECHSPEPLKQAFLSQQQSSKPAWIRWEGHHKYYIGSEAFAVNSAGTIPASHWERFLGNRKLSGVCNNFWSDIEIFNIPYYTTGSRVLMQTLHTVAFNRKQSLCSGGGICKIIFPFLLIFFLITSDFSCYLIYWTLYTAGFKKKTVQGEVWQSQGQAVLCRLTGSSLQFSELRLSHQCHQASAVGFQGLFIDRALSWV